MRRQRPIKGGRQPLPSLVIKDIKREVDRMADRFDVSHSFVVAVILADWLGIEKQETFFPEMKKKIHA